MSTAWSLTTLCLFLAHSAIVSASTTFFYPTGGLVFDVRDTVVVEYESDYENPALALWYTNSSCSSQAGAAHQIYAISVFVKSDQR